jgi:flavin-dependent dehydrogenase
VSETVTGRVLSRGGGIIPLAPATTVMRGNVFLFGDSAGIVYPPSGEGLRYIARMSGPWADCITTGRNLNARWRLSRTFAMLYSGSVAIRALSGLERRLGIRPYPRLCRVAARLLSIVRPSHVTRPPVTGSVV